MQSHHNKTVKRGKIKITVERGTCEVRKNAPAISDKVHILDLSEEFKVISDYGGISGSAFTFGRAETLGRVEDFIKHSLAHPEADGSITVKWFAKGGK